MPGAGTATAQLFFEVMTAAPESNWHTLVLPHDGHCGGGFVSRSLIVWWTVKVFLHSVHSNS